jgi:hypothetical protein
MPKDHKRNRGVLHDRPGDGETVRRLGASSGLYIEGQKGRLPIRPTGGRSGARPAGPYPYAAR